MELFDWSLLGTNAGAAMAVAVLTQITKEIPGIVKIPTQLWSYILALLTLLLADAVRAGLQRLRRGSGAVQRGAGVADGQRRLRGGGAGEIGTEGRKGRIKRGDRAHFRPIPFCFFICGQPAESWVRDASPATDF